MTPATAVVLERQVGTDRGVNVSSLRLYEPAVDYKPHLSFLNVVVGDLKELVESSGLKGEELSEQVNLHIKVVNSGLRDLALTSGLEGDKLSEQVGDYARVIKETLNYLQESGVELGSQDLVHYERPSRLGFNVGERVPTFIFSGRCLDSSWMTIINYFQKEPDRKSDREVYESFKQMFVRMGYGSLLRAGEFCEEFRNKSENRA